MSSPKIDGKTENVGDERGACAICGVPSTLKCSGCWQAYYCTREHQKKSWAEHKTACRPFKVGVDKVLGRYVEASRKINRAELVLKEEPLLVGPSQTTPPVCLGCHNILEKDELVPCDLCGWPMCSTRCSQSPHHVPECKWTQEKRKSKVKITQLVSPHPTYGCIMPLRYCYLKFNNPKRFAKLNMLESHRDVRSNTFKYEADKFGIVQLLRRFYNITEEEFTDQELMDICGVIQVNGHEVPLSEPGHVAIYSMGSLWEHNCLPNCSKSFTSSGALIFRAARDILPGEHLSISYTDPMWPTPMRRNHLLDTKFFSCVCARCSDPTEMGTYFSAICCIVTGGCAGKMLPETFLEEREEWTCNVCGGKAKSTQVGAALRDATRLMAADKGSVESCRRLLLDPTDGAPGAGVLHQDNYIVVELAIALAQLYGQSPSLQSISDDWLHHKLVLCRRILELSQILAPAECRLRGGLMFELHAAIAETGRRQAAIGLIDTSELYDMLLESKKHLQDANDLLKYEPEILPEGKMAKQAVENLNDLEKVLMSIRASAISIK